MGRNKGSRNIFKETVCGCCGKTIIIINKENYVYRLKKKGKMYWYCSYSCWRKSGG